MFSRTIKGKRGKGEKIVEHLVLKGLCHEMNIILMQLPVKSPELVSFFTEASRTLIVFFYTIKKQNLNTIGAYTESTALIFKTFQKVLIS